MGRVIIYGLIDPQRSVIFYVGKTSASLFKQRIANHVRDARNNSKTKCHRWLRGMLAAGVAVETVILERSAESQWVTAERFWIKYLRHCGCPLANLTAGGDGAPGRKQTAQAVEKTRLAHLGARRTAEAKARMHAAWTAERKVQHVAMCKTRVVRQETREKISKANSGKVRSEEFKRRVGTAFRGKRLSEEHKRKAAAGVRRAWTPERRIKQAARMRAMRREAEAKRAVVVSRKAA